MKISGIKVIIWDFDGTLYQANPALWHDIREAEYKTIMHHTGWNHERTEQEFNAVYKKTIQSATQTVSFLTGVPTNVAAVEMEDYYDRSKYLIYDEKLVALFRKLSGFTHYILGNGGKAGIVKTLGILGVLPGTFAEIVTSEITKINKPDPAGFHYIMNKTGVAAEAHLMIGDRDAVDIVPAKKLGMKTCFVWGESTIADVSIPTVYDVPTVLL